MIPNDPVILLSFINTKLRDTGMSFTELCRELEADADAVSEKLSEIGCSYSAEQNRFI